MELIVRSSGDNLRLNPQISVAVEYWRWLIDNKTCFLQYIPYLQLNNVAAPTNPMNSEFELYLNETKLKHLR